MADNKPDQKQPQKPEPSKTEPAKALEPLPEGQFRFMVTATGKTANIQDKGPWGPYVDFDEAGALGQAVAEKKLDTNPLVLHAEKLES